MKVISLSVPEYSVDSEPDCKTIGKAIDDELKKHFLNQHILLRGIGSLEHPDKSMDELIELIKTNGTDRYDSNRVGDRYSNVENKHIDLFAFPVNLQLKTEVAWQIIYGFYHSAIGIHGRPTRIDIITVYDADKLNVVEHQYEGKDDIKRDGFAFKDPEHKKDALLGVMKLL